MNKFPILLFVLSMVVFTAQAQKKAVTDTGEQVLLYDDGTWKYVNPAKIKETQIATNPKKFTKPSASTFLLKSKVFNVGIWINTQKWRFKKLSDNQEVEYEIDLRQGDLYAMMLCERASLPLKALKMAALGNAKEVAPDIKLVKEEYRMVNGKKVLCLQMAGTTQGISIVYYSYYYSNDNGSVQLVTYAAKNLFAEMETKAETLLNGLVEIEK